MLEEAIVNLLDNAVKYSEKNSKIRITARKEEGALIIKIQDWGKGIPEEHLPRIFERFYRIDKARSRSLGGTGLGLAIVKHIVQAHDGYVTVESKPDEGSIFTVHIPVVFLSNDEGIIR